MSTAEIGSRIKQLRQHNNMTIDELSHILGITPGFVGLIEHGKRGTKIKSLIKISEIFNVSLDYLITGKDFDNSIIESKSEDSGYKFVIESLKALNKFSFEKEELEYLTKVVVYQANQLKELKKIKQ